MNFYGRDFLRILDFSEAELRYMLEMAKVVRLGTNTIVTPDTIPGTVRGMMTLRSTVDFEAPKS